MLLTHSVSYYMPKGQPFLLLFGCGGNEAKMLVASFCVLWVLLIAALFPLDSSLYRSVAKKGPVSNIHPPPIIASIFCKDRLLQKAPTQLTSCGKFQMQHDTRLVYSYTYTTNLISLYATEFHITLLRVVGTN